MKMRRMKMNKKELTIQGYTPHAGQIKLHQLMAEKAWIKYWIFNCGRQFGKSIMLIMIGLDACLNIIKGEITPNVWYISQTAKTAKTTFAKILKVICNTNGTFDRRIIKSINKTLNKITFTNGATFTVNSSESEMRGDSITTLILDEFSFYSDADRVWNDLYPALGVTGKKCYIISTPFGKNKFFDLYMQGQDEDLRKKEKGYYSVTCPSYENPYFDKDELEYLEKYEPEQYRQEICGDFLDDAATVFKGLDSCVYTDKDFYDNVYNPNYTYCLGQDLATKSDYSVSIIYELETGRIVDMWRKNKMKDWDEVIDNITRMYFKWNVSAGLVEINFNSRILEELHKRGCVNLKEWRTTNESKTIIVQNLQLAITSKKIKVPTDKAFLNEMKAFTKKFDRDTNKIKFEGPKNGNDDIPIAVMLAVKSAEQAYANSGTINCFWL